MPKPNLVLGEASRASMLRGFETMGRLVSLTLGPVRGTIANEREGTREIELLRDAATAVRRVIQLPEPTEDPGAMLMRHIVWNMREEVGDGSATSAVIALALAREAQRVIAAGANAMILRRGIEKALAVALDALDRQSLPLDTEETIASVATAAGGDREIGKVLGEIYDVLGPNAQVTIVPYVATYHDRAYRDGARFEGSYFSPYLLTDQVNRTAVLEDVHVLVADMVIDTAEGAAYLLDLVAQLGGKRLLIVCKKISDKAIGALVANNERDTVQSTATSLKPIGDARRGTVENIAILTGGQPLNDRAGLVPEQVTADDLGYAERVVVEKNQFLIIGGRGSRQEIQARMDALRSRLRISRDPEERETLRLLTSQLTNGIAELRVGGMTPAERTRLTEISQHAIRAVEAGMESGIVPGGGAAYLACIPAVRELKLEGDEAIGAGILARVLEEPLRQIAANTGVHPPLAVSDAQRLGPGHGLDAVSGKTVNMIEHGIADPTIVARRALEHGVSGAMMLLTTEALVIHRKPQESVNP
ncbi:MAG: chaperonin GroEL [Anaerolineae bacterium]|jgi:chaperonin GroEL|nr:chaperonin GroEL [Chloroflexota bacterium]